MRRKQLSRAALFLCWLAAAGILLWLWWDNRQVTFVGESQNWRAVYCYPAFSLGEKPREGKDQGVFVLTYLGDREEYRSHQAICIRYRRIGSENSYRVEADAPGELPRRFRYRQYSLGWTEPMLERVTVEVSLDDGPAERFVLEKRR